MQLRHLSVLLCACLYPGIVLAAAPTRIPAQATISAVTVYQDRAQVQDCELLHLADLRTESDRVRDRLAGYLNRLLALGVDGFRVDAAKHIPATDVAAIWARCWVLVQVSSGRRS